MLRFAKASFLLPSLVVASALVTYACSSSDEEKPADTTEPPAREPEQDAGPGTTEDAGTKPENDGGTPTEDAGAVNPIANVAAATAITDPSFGGFADGPIVVGDTLFFSDVTSSVIVRYAPLDQTDKFPAVRTAGDIGPRFPIGSTFDTKTGVILTAESEPSATPTNRISRWFPDGGSATPAAVAFDGGAPAWDSPNDVVVRASDGTIYVSDPGYQLQAGTPANKLLRIAPGGGTTVEKTFAGGEQPNGVALSPDGTTLYVSLTASETIVKYPVAADGTLGAEGAFAAASPDPDGLGVDEAGNVYVATGAGVAVFAPSGTSWGVVATPKAATGVAFGGADRKTLYVTTNGAVYAVTGLAIAGLGQ